MAISLGLTVLRSILDWCKSWTDQLRASSELVEWQVLAVRVACAC